MADTDTTQTQDTQITEQGGAFGGTTTGQGATAGDDTAVDFSLDMDDIADFSLDDLEIPAENTVDSAVDTLTDVANDAISDVKIGITDVVDDVKAEADDFVVDFDDLASEATPSGDSAVDFSLDLDSLAVDTDDSQLEVDTPDTTTTTETEAEVPEFSLDDLEIPASAVTADVVADVDASIDVVPEFSLDELEVPATDVVAPVLDSIEESVEGGVDTATDVVVDTIDDVKAEAEDLIDGIDLSDISLDTDPVTNTDEAIEEVADVSIEGGGIDLGIDADLEVDETLTLDDAVAPSFDIVEEDVEPIKEVEDTSIDLGDVAVVAAATAVVSDELATESEFVKVERPADLSPMAKKFFDLLDLVKEGVAVSGTDEFDVVASSGSSHNIHYFVSSEDKSFTVRREEVSKEDESDSEIDVLSMEYHEDDKLVHLLLNDVMLFDDHPAQEKAHQNVHTVSEKMSKFTMLFDSYVSDTKKKKAQAEAEKQEREEKKALSSKLRKF